MKKYIRIIALICLTALTITFLCGCGYMGYKKEYKGAYTLVYSQVPDILGARASIGLYDPQILLLEKDSYDRGLYLYYEDSDSFLTVAIVQKENEERVYYYPEESTLSYAIPDSMYDLDNPELSEERLRSMLAEFFTDEDMESFKAQNDWNSPLNEDKLDSAEITSPRLIVRWSHRGHDAQIELFSDEWREVMIDVAIENGHNITEDNLDSVYLNYVSWMATDDYGRKLYYVDGYYYVDGDEQDPSISSRRYYLEMVAITNADGSFDADTFMLELEDKANYQDVIRELKEINGWNQPLSEVEK